jgi:hypothetical protein
MNMVFQEPKCVITIGIGQDAGLDDVPEARFMRCMLAGFISTIFMLPLAGGGESPWFMPGIPGIGGMGWFWPPARTTEKARTNPVTTNCFSNIRPLPRHAVSRALPHFHEHKIYEV